MQWSMDELTCHAPILPCGQHDQHRVVEAPYDNRKLPLTLYGADRASGTAASRGGGDHDHQAAPSAANHVRYPLHLGMFKNGVAACAFHV